MSSPRFMEDNPGTSGSAITKHDLVWFDSGAGYFSPGVVDEILQPGEPEKKSATPQDSKANPIVFVVQPEFSTNFDLPNNSDESQKFDRDETPQHITITASKRIQKRMIVNLTSAIKHDLTELEEQTEPAVLWTLRLRYERNVLYTTIGSHVMIALNPYREVIGLFNSDAIKRYSTSANTPPTHLYTIGRKCHSTMLSEHEGQIILLTGETGSGKTECFKRLVDYFVASTPKLHSTAIHETEKRYATLKLAETNKRILEGLALMESFGNATTPRNENASRYGKYLELYYHKQGALTGAQFTEFLLEKNRVVAHNHNERGFHIFYEMLAGLRPELKDKFGLTSASKFFYLSQGGAAIVGGADSPDAEGPGRNDAEFFQKTQAALEAIGFTNDQQHNIWRILAAVLHIGNIYFHKMPHAVGPEGVKIANEAEVKWVAYLLQIPLTQLTDALTLKPSETKDEHLTIPLGIDRALDVRDAIAKFLYSSLVSWIAIRVNKLIGHPEKEFSIALIDTFGFESLKHNELEQLAINFADERLQAFYLSRTVQLDQAAYAKERIPWKEEIGAKLDNQPIVDLLIKRPLGILSILDDESCFPKGSEDSFLLKCHYNHLDNSLYGKSRMGNADFCVRHYAGPVWYEVPGIVDKNRDIVPKAVTDLLQESQNTVISQFFKPDTRSNLSFKKPKSPRATVSSTFMETMNQLIGKLETFEKPYFVRCIRPNNTKFASKFDLSIVQEQLKNLGIIETLKMKKNGFTYHFTFKQFLERYHSLVPSEEAQRTLEDKELIGAILEKETATRFKGNYQIGESKVFVREDLYHYLDSTRDKEVKAAATKIQKHVRGFVARRKFQQKRQAVVKLQAAARGWRSRKQYCIIRKDFRDKALAARAAVQRLGTDRVFNAQHSVATVRHLDIPKELTYTIEARNAILGGGLGEVVKAIGHIVPLEQQFCTPHDLKEHSLEKFVEANFKSNHILAMRREPILTPFLEKETEAEFEDSLKLFKLILRFMNDASFTKTQQELLGNYIVQKGIEKVSLRDEIYCQIVNQTKNNSNAANAERAWFLLAACASCFSPSLALFKPLLNYVSTPGVAPESLRQQIYAKLQGGVHSENSGLRRHAPTMIEWEAILQRGKYSLASRLVDGSQANCQVESWTSAGEFANNVLGTRGIRFAKGWTTFMSAPGSDYVLAGSDYLLDAIAHYESPLAKRLPKAAPCLIFSNRRSPPPDNLEKPGSRRPSNPEDPVMASVVSSSSLNQRYRQESGAQHQVLSTQTSGRTSGMGSERQWTPLYDRPTPQQRQSESRPMSRRSDCATPVVVPEKLPKEPTTPQPVEKSKVKQQIEQFEKKKAMLSGGNSPPPQPPRPTVANSNVVKSQQPKSSNQRQAVPQERRSPFIPSGCEFDPAKMIPAHRPAAPPQQQTQTQMLQQQEDKQQPQTILGQQRNLSDDSLGSDPPANQTQLISENDIYDHRQRLPSEYSVYSVASHVRGVAIPSKNSDVEKFLDDLFDPVLKDSNLDEIFDVKSITASIKGTGGPVGVESPQAIIRHHPPHESVLHHAEQQAVDQHQQQMIAFSSTAAIPQPTFPASAPPVIPPVIMMVPMHPDAFKYAWQGISSQMQGIPPGDGSPVLSRQSWTMPTALPMVPYQFPGYMPVQYGAQSSGPCQAIMGSELTSSTTTMSLSANIADIPPEPKYPPSALPPSTSIDVGKRSHGSWINGEQETQSGPYIEPRRLAPVTLDDNDEPDRMVQHAGPGSGIFYTQMRASSTTARYVPSPVQPGLSTLTRDSALRASEERQVPSHQIKDILDQSRPRAGAMGGQVASAGRHGAATSSGSGAEGGFREQISPIGSPNLGDRNHHYATVASAQTQQPSKTITASVTKAVHGYVADSPQLAKERNAGLERASRFGSFHSNEEDEQTKLQEQALAKIRAKAESLPPPVDRTKISRYQQQQQMHSSAQSQQRQWQEGSAISNVMAKDYRPHSVDRAGSTLRSDNYGKSRLAEPGESPPPATPIIQSASLNRPRDYHHEMHDASRSRYSYHGSAPEYAKGLPRSSHFNTIEGSPSQQHRYGREATPPEPTSRASFVPEQIGLTQFRQQARRESAESDWIPDEEMTLTRNFQRMGTIERRQALEEQLREARLATASFYDPNLHKSRYDGSSSINTPKDDRYSTKQPPNQGSADQKKSDKKKPAHFFTYKDAPWELVIRKELWLPGESIDDPTTLDLIFLQVVQDTFQGISYRIRREDRKRMLAELDAYRIDRLDGLDPSRVPHMQKRNVIAMAREWPLYFSRFYPVVEAQESEFVATVLGIHESGIRLIGRNYDNADEPFRVLDYFSFEEIRLVDVDVENGLVLQTNNGLIVKLFTDNAWEAKACIEEFLSGPNQARKYVRAVADYITKEPNLLSFHKDEIIRLENRVFDDTYGLGWLYGRLGNRYGNFPREYVEFLGDPEQAEAREAFEISSILNQDFDADGKQQPGGEQIHGKYTMMEFAMQFFRQPHPRKYGLQKTKDGTLKGTLTSTDKKSGAKEWTWREMAELVKFSKSGISTSLLKLDNADYNRLAAESFTYIQQYMGDHSMKKNQTVSDCVYAILTICHQQPPMRDEIYCQIVKQTTNNKSSKPDSCIKGWRLFSILAAYFDCSDVLKPYLFKYLSEAATDSRRAYYGTASICLQNLVKTFKYGGRKYLLNVKEIEAVSTGKNLKRQIYHWPGGSQKVINTKTVTVVEDIIQELCQELNVLSPLEQQEFCLCTVVESENLMKLLANDEYILDITTELENANQDYYLLLKRTVWIHPLRMDNDMYIDVMFFQVVPDYLEGLLVIMRSAETLSAAMMDDIAVLGALLNKADDKAEVDYVNERNVSQVLPKIVQNVRSVNYDQWADRVNTKMRQLSKNLTKNQARAKFLEILQNWPLFGSSFFYIVSASDARVHGECLLAINKHGLQLIDIITHETLLDFRFSEIVSTHKVSAPHPNTGIPVQFLDMKVGSSLQQRILTLQTDQGAEISRLLGQYIFVDSQNRGFISSGSLSD